MSLATPLMSERARAWLASVKDVPPDQLSQHATQAAQTGMISFGDAIALKQMADRISGAAKKDAPSPTSVVQDLKQQIQNPQPVQQVNMPAGQEAPQDPRMQGGIATLPAPAMDNMGSEASMANGGIVAFAGGGTDGSPNHRGPKYPPEFMEVIGPLLVREGGYVNNPKDKGGPTKYGISKNAHPNLDIKNLTKQQAIQIYYNEYWKGSGADKVYANDPVAAHILMDSAVQMGPQKAIKLWNETGGDVNKIIDERERRLRVQAKESTQGDFAKGWDNRMQDLRDIVAKGNTGLPPNPAVEGMKDPTVQTIVKPPVKIPGLISEKETPNSPPYRGIIDRTAAPAPAAPVVPPRAAAPAGIPTVVPPRAAAPAPAPAPAASPPPVPPSGIPSAPAPAAAGIPAALPTTGEWAGVGTAGMTGRVVPPKQRFLADVLKPGAAPATPEEAARFEKAFGPNWRTRYGGEERYASIEQPDGSFKRVVSGRGMTHTLGMDVSGPRPEIVGSSNKTAAETKPAGPEQAVEASALPDDAPLLNPIDVDAEMRRQGVSKQDRLLMLANAGFKMAQAASQPGAKFLGSAAVGGGEAAQGLAALNADQRGYRRALQEAAYKREEALAALGLKGRELDIQERLGLGKISADALRASAALKAQNLQAQKFLATDPDAMKAMEVMREEEENAKKYPNSASATRYNIAKQRYDMLYARVMGDILLNQQVAATLGAHPGYSAD